MRSPRCAQDCEYAPYILNVPVLGYCCSLFIIYRKRQLNDKNSVMELIKHHFEEYDCVHSGVKRKKKGLEGNLIDDGLIDCGIMGFIVINLLV